MRYILINIFLSLTFLCCNKNNNSSSACTCNCSIGISPNTSGIVGCWKFIAVNTYSAPLSYNNWQPVSNSDRAAIQFLTDSTFRYNSLFPWKDHHYDHYKTENGYAYLYSATSGPVPGDIFAPDASLTIINANELVLTRHGVDAGIQEKYERY